MGEKLVYIIAFYENQHLGDVAKVDVLDEDLLCEMDAFLGHTRTAETHFTSIKLPHEE